MIGQCSRRSAVAQALLLGLTGLILATGLVGEAREAGTTGAVQEPLPGPVLALSIASGPGGIAPAAASQPEVCTAEPAFEAYLAHRELVPPAAEAVAREQSDAVERPAASSEPQQTAPLVAVRAGRHPGFARIVFDWPEAIAYQVVRQADLAIVVFERPGRIDLSGLRERLGIEARTDGAISRRVVLRLPADARIRASSLEGDRIVLDLLEPPARPTVAPASRPAAADPVADLRQTVQERDAVIEDLLARVRALEQRPVLASADLDQIAGGEAGNPAAPAATPAAPAPGPSQDQTDGAPAAPGAFDVDEQEIDRALERTLVQTGVLLLPFGQAEIEPSFTFTRQEADSPTFIANDGAMFSGERKVRRSEYEIGMDLRFGLPLDAQFELGLPYRFVDQSTSTEFGFTTLDGADGSGSGLGDLSVGIAKTLLREKRWWPDLVGRITWDTDSGDTTDNDVVLGGGFNEVRGSLSAVKRQDPLAFSAGLSYQTTFEKDDVKPGDEFGFSIGAALAASPETSLHVGFDQRFGNEVEVAGESINGSDVVLGMASVGASVVIDHGALLDVTLDVGLTEDAPDYAVRVSLPIRFNLPSL